GCMLYASHGRATLSLHAALPSSPSVVNVTNIAMRRDRWTWDVARIPQGTGTGFIWDTAGHIVTNFHVIEGANQVLVTLVDGTEQDRKSTRLNSSHVKISYAVFCL